MKNSRQLRKDFKNVGIHIKRWEFKEESTFKKRAKSKKISENKCIIEFYNLQAEIHSETPRDIAKALINKYDNGDINTLHKLLTMDKNKGHLTNLTREISQINSDIVMIPVYHIKSPAKEITSLKVKHLTVKHNTTNIQTHIPEEIPRNQSLADLIMQPDILALHYIKFAKGIISRCQKGLEFKAIEYDVEKIIDILQKIINTYMPQVEELKNKH